MAHNLTAKDQMFSVSKTKTPPWHGLGKVVTDAPSIEEGIKLANLDWNVKLEKLNITSDGRTVTHKAVVREDTNDVLGIVGPNWKPLQNREAFNFFDSFLETGQVELETAGSLRGGEIVWVLAKIKSSVAEVMKNDPIERYVLLSNGHNGMLAVRAGFVTQRVVCSNTLSAAHNSEASKLIRIKHSSKVVENLENVKTIMSLADSEFRANIEQLKLLTKKEINQKDIQNFVKLTFFEKTKIDSTRAENRFSTIVRRMEELIEIGRGADTKGVKGTVWGLYNAGTEYLTHEIGKDSETRLNSLWFGQNAKLNDRLLNVALAIAV